jgi:hypothetical protein
MLVGFSLQKIDVLTINRGNRLAIGASRPNLKSRTARLDDTRDSRVIYTGYAFNATKKKGIWKGYMEEKRGLTGSGVTERWLASGAAGSATWPPATAGRERGCRKQHLGQATTSPSVPAVAILAGLRR